MECTRMRISEKTFIFIIIISILLSLLAMSINDWQPLQSTGQEQVAVVIIMGTMFMLGFAAGAVE